LFPKYSWIKCVTIEIITGFFWKFYYSCFHAHSLFHIVHHSFYATDILFLITKCLPLKTLTIFSGYFNKTTINLTRKIVIMQIHLLVTELCNRCPKKLKTISSFVLNSFKNKNIFMTNPLRVRIAFNTNTNPLINTDERDALQ